MYRIRILDAATRELARLDKPVSPRIVERINWLAAHLGVIRLEALTGDPTGLYKLRVGGPSRRTDYRDSCDWSPQRDLSEAVTGPQG